MKHFVIKLFLLISYVTGGYSHPHTFIEVKPIVEIKDSTINKIHIKWTMDEMTSMMLIMELDSNANGRFEKEENDFIYNNYFLSLGEYGFYMHLAYNLKLIPLPSPTNFKASIENNRLIYAFDIEQELPVKDLEIVFFDKEYFVGMMLEKEYITFNGINEKKSALLKQQIFRVK